MLSITRRFQFCAGHRVFKHEGKCMHPHGHNYVLYATFTATDQDKLGRIIDFSVLKDRLGKWIDQNWDHGFIYFKDDLEIKKTFSANSEWKTYQLESNPTAENMCIHLVEKICPELFDSLEIKCIEAELWETENCKATYRKSNNG